MRRLSCSPVFSCLLLAGVLLLAAQPAEAQIWKKAKEAAERAAEREAARRADAAVTAAFEIADDAVRCAADDTACTQRAEAEGRQVVYVDANGEPLPVEEQHASSGGPAAPVAGSAAGGVAETTRETVWDGYDFVPGERVLFFHDFEGTRTGNFPSRLDYLAGNLDVVELGDNKVLRVGEGTSESGPGGNGCFTIVLPETLPERYTVEFRVRTSDPLHRANIQLFSDASDDSPDTRCTYPPNPHVFIGRHEQGLQLPGGYGAPKSAGNVGLGTDTWHTVALGCDGPYCKMYVDGTRVANVPKYDFPRAEKLHVFMNTYRYSAFLDDVRIAEGGPRSLYDDLEADGAISTTAIRFASGSDRIEPESTGILTDLLALLDDHGDLRLQVEGHTDSEGADEANADLSERRAASVVAWLEARGVAPGRLDPVGRGEGEPVADNATPEGRAENRRVVFRKL